MANTAFVIGLIVLALALAALTYHVVEQPFRKRGRGGVVPLRNLIIILTASSLSLAAIGGVLASGSALPSDTPTATLDQEIEAKLAINFGLHEDCEGAFTLSENCRTSETPTFLLWGDSFAMHLAPAIEAGTPWRGMVQHTKSVCAPIPGISVVTPEYPVAWAEGCLAFNAQVLDWLSNQPSIEYVVVSSPFGLVFNDLLLANGEIIQDGQQDAVRQSLIDTSVRLAEMGKSLVVVSPPLVTGEDIGQCLAATLRSNRPADSCDFAPAEAHPSSHNKIGFVRSLEPNLPVVHIEDMMCLDGMCDTMVGDTFLFRDAGHLSIEGSLYLEQNFGLVRRIVEAAQSAN